MSILIISAYYLSQSLPLSTHPFISSSLTSPVISYSLSPHILFFPSHPLSPHPFISSSITSPLTSSLSSYLSPSLHLLLSLPGRILCDDQKFLNIASFPSTHPLPSSLSPHFLSPLISSSLSHISSSLPPHILSLLSQDVFSVMMRNLFEEYRFFPQYPDRELRITAELFGGIIQRSLLALVST